MGTCFSSKSQSDSLRRPLTPSANVVSIAGELRQYSTPVTVSEVLRHETLSPASFFLCDSNRLSFDDYVPPLSQGDELEPEQIYFVLPVSKLRHRLAASEMAAMAVKASAALSDSNRRRNRKPRISPSPANGEEGSRSNHRIPISVKKLKHRRSAFRRAKLTVRSFKVRLTTINEGSVLL